MYLGIGFVVIRLLDWVVTSNSKTTPCWIILLLLSNLRTRFSRPDGKAVVKAGEEGMPMMTIDYESPEEAEETLFSHLEIYLENLK